MVLDVYRDSLCNRSNPVTRQDILDARDVKQVEHIVKKVNEKNQKRRHLQFDLVSLSFGRIYS